MTLKILKQIGWLLMAGLAIWIAISAAGPYLSLNPNVSRIPLNPDLPIHFGIIVIHATTGGLALLLGPFQFLSRLRRRKPGIHRLIGRTYLICILIGSIFAFAAALASVDGFAAQMGFATLAVLWFYSALQAYRAIRKGQLQLHRIWMVRNYTLTLAAVFLRLILQANTIMNLPFQEVYVVAAWSCWAIPLAIAEWSINQKLLQTLTQKKIAVDPSLQATIPLSDTILP